MLFNLPRGIAHSLTVSLGLLKRLQRKGPTYPQPLLSSENRQGRGTLSPLSGSFRISHVLVGHVDASVKEAAPLVGFTCSEDWALHFTVGFHKMFCLEALLIFSLLLNSLISPAIHSAGMCKLLSHLKHKSICLVPALRTVLLPCPWSFFYLAVSLLISVISLRFWFSFPITNDFFFFFF